MIAVTPICLHIIYGCFHRTAELSSFNKDHRPAKHKYLPSGPLQKISTSSCSVCVHDYVCLICKQWKKSHLCYIFCHLFLYYLLLDIIITFGCWTYANITHNFSVDGPINNYKRKLCFYFFITYNMSFGTAALLMFTFEWCFYWWWYFLPTHQTS